MTDPLDDTIDFIAHFRHRLAPGEQVWTHDDHQCAIATVLRINQDTVTVSNDYTDHDDPYDVPRSKVFPTAADARDALREALRPS